MEVFYRNRIIKVLFGVPAYLLTGLLCTVGLMKTTSEMGDQNFWFVYIVLAILGCATMTLVFNTKKVKLGVADAMATAMFVWYVVTCIANDSIAVSKLMEIYLLASMYVSLRVLLSSHRNLGKWLFVVLCLCGIIEATTGIKQAFGTESSNHSLFSVTGTFFNPGPYGGYLAVILSLALGYLNSKYEYAQKIFGSFKRIQNISICRILWALIFCTAICTVITTIIILPATMSRAAFVAVGGAVISIILSNGRVHKPVVDYVRRHKKRAVVIGIMSVVVICGSLYGIYIFKKDSADGRLLMWKITAGVIAENPVTGVGPGYFRGAYGDVQAEYFRVETGSESEIKVAGSPEYGFNEYLQTGAETGAIGLVLFIVFVAVALLRLLRRGSPYTFGLLALMVFAFFSYPFSLLSMKILFVMLLAVAGSCPFGRREANAAQKIAVGVVFAVCVGMAAFATKPYLERIEATKEWQESRRWYSMDMFSYVLEDYPKLLPLMKENPAFMFEYGRSLNMEGRYTESIDLLLAATKLSNDPMNYNVIGNNYKALGEYDKAAEAYLKAYYIVPNRMYPLYLLGKMYSEIGDVERAEHYARMVVEMTPKVPSSATDDMQREMQDVLMRE